MAAEKPLLQDPPREVRLLRWSWWPGQDARRHTPQAHPQGSLLLPEEPGWGLTELLVLDSEQVLALLRRFELPLRWHIRLAVYPLPSSADDPPAAPLEGWDLIAAGLTPHNWEGLTSGPPLADGRPSLLLVSDDNLNPLQASRVAQLVPLQRAGRSPGCPADSGHPRAAATGDQAARLPRALAPKPIQFLLDHRECLALRPQAMGVLSGWDGQQCDEAAPHRSPAHPCLVLGRHPAEPDAASSSNRSRQRCSCFLAAGVPSAGKQVRKSLSALGW